MKLKNILPMLMLLVTLMSCSEEEKNPGEVEPEIIFTPENIMHQTVYADETDSVHGIGFDVNTIWLVNVKDVTTRGVENTTDWIRLDQYGGGRGSFNLTITTDSNKTGADRKAEIVITCGGKTTFSVLQKGVVRSREH